MAKQHSAQEEEELAKNLWIYIGNLDWHSAPDVVERALAQILQSIPAPLVGASAEGEPMQVDKKLSDITLESE
eukprot:3113016-Rhodomonas_salina.1